MSASGLRERLQTVDGVVREAAILGIRLTPEQASRCVLIPSGGITSWQVHRDAVSVGPTVYLRNRLAELGCDYGRGMAEDDSLPIIFKTHGRKRRLEAAICDVARSKMFNTPLVVYPIDITAMRVAGQR